MARVPVCDAVAQALLCYPGVPLFGVIGDGNLFVVNAFVERGGTYVSAANEGPAVLMAEGFASVSGRVGFATVTHGVLTNAVTALTDATRARIPLVVVAGEVAGWDADNVQRLPQARLTEPTGAAFVAVQSADGVAMRVHEAVARARAESRPVVLTVPADLMWEETDTADPPHAPLAVASVDEAAVDAAVWSLVDSARPVIVAGRGASGPAHREALLELARRVGARVATTLRAKELFRGDHRDLGVFGGLATPETVAYVRDSDCLAVFGASLNTYTTEMGRLTHGKRIVRIDVDPSAGAQAQTFVCGDSAHVVTEMLARLEPEPALAAAPRADPVRAANDDAVDAAAAALTLSAALDGIDRLLPADRTLVVDGGRVFFDAVRRVRVTDPRNYVHALSIGHIGLSPGLGIGAAHARPESTAVVVCGDGGLMLSGLGELNTAVRHGVRLVLVVLNDSCYGAEHHQLSRRSLGTALSHFDWPDLAGVARSLGMHGVTVSAPGDLDAVAEALAAGRYPLLVDVRLDSEAIPMTFSRSPSG
jgi:thiamine pyrophosphate-dependent acetolactate synthase large subunit-like protein